MSAYRPGDGNGGVANHFYFDRDDQMDAVKLLPSEYFVTAKPMVLTTVLGSCVSACIRDSAAGIGGMNHFMLPGDGMYDRQGGGLRYGEQAMRTLVEEICRRGGRRDRMEAKVFGGGRVIAGMASRIGEANALFAMTWLEREGIRVLAQDLNGEQARRVHYLPASGQVRVRRLYASENVRHREETLIESLLKAPHSRAVAAGVKGAGR